MTTRFGIAGFGAALLLISQLLALTPASAQLYNPATPTGPAPILPATPPQAVPSMAAPPAAIGESSRTSQRAAVPSLSIGRPSRETHNDRSIRCSHQGAAQGVPSGAMGQYVRDCVNN